MPKKLRNHKKPSLAERQTAAQQASEKEHKAKEKSDRLVQNLQKEIKALKQQHKQAEATSSTDDRGLGQQEGADKQALLEAIKFYKRADQKDRPGIKELLDREEGKLAELQKAELSKKPLDEQVRRSQKKVESCDKFVERLAKESRDLADRMDKLRAQQQELQSKQASAEEELAQAKRCRDQLLQSHSTVPPSAVADSSGGIFDTVGDMVQLLAARMGTTSGSQQLLEHLQQCRNQWMAMQKEDEENKEAESAASAAVEELQRSSLEAEEANSAELHAETLSQLASQGIVNDDLLADNGDALMQAIERMPPARRADFTEGVAKKLKLR